MSRQQQIRDRFDAMGREEAAARQRASEQYRASHKTEWDRLREECSALGHVFVMTEVSRIFCNRRSCAACGTAEPEDPTATNLAKVA